MNRRRLDAEAIRDSLLMAAGKLDRTMGGPAVREMDVPRRTLYLMTIRSDRTTYRSLFDAADPTGIVEKRIDSTVAPQALLFFNDPFVLAQARALRERLEREGGSEVRRRIDWLYRLLYGRPAEEREVEIGSRAIAQTGADATLAWDQYCQALLAADEFIYVD